MPLYGSLKKNNENQHMKNEKQSSPAQPDFAQIQHVVFCVTTNWRYTDDHGRPMCTTSDDDD